MVVIYFNYCSSSIILLKEDKIGVTCSTHTREVLARFLLENLKERDHLEDFSIICRTILKSVLKI
jgi:hypothetical protein